MKLPNSTRVSNFGFRISNFRSATSPVTRHSSRQSGLAVILMLILISIILIYIAGNLRMLHHLNRDLQLVEQKQIQRLNPPHSRTNAPSASKAPGASAH